MRRIERVLVAGDSGRQSLPFYGPPQSQPRAQPTQLSHFLVVRGLLDAEEFLDPRLQ
jgi:hypothetical protein